MLCPRVARPTAESLKRSGLNITISWAGDYGLLPKDSNAVSTGLADLNIDHRC